LAFREGGILSKKAITLFGVAAATLVTVVPTAISAPPRLSCGQTITASVTLTRDLVNCPGDGLVVGAPNVTVDLGGHQITGSKPTSYGDPAACICGVNDMAGFDHVTLRNGHIDGFRDGARFSDATGVAVVDLTSGGHYENGVFLERTPNSTISQSKFSSSYRGVAVNDSSGLTVDGVGISDIQHSAVALFRVTDSVVRASTISLRPAESEWGVELVNSSRITVTHNQIRGWGADGVGVVGMRQNGGLPAVSNSVVDNDLSHGSTGIELIEVDGGTVSDTLVARNYIHDTSDSGILVDAGSSQDGSGRPPLDYLVGVGPRQSRIVDNLTVRNSLDGIHLDAPTSLVARNVADHNGNWGIFAVDGTTDGGGNRAHANGQPAQCSGVACS
jgi:hypothetical protein